MQTETIHNPDGTVKVFLTEGKVYAIGYGMTEAEAYDGAFEKITKRLAAASPYPVGAWVLGKYAGQPFAGKITYSHEIPCFEQPSNWYVKIALDKPITVSMRGKLSTIETEIHGDGSNVGVIKTEIQKQGT